MILNLTYDELAERLGITRNAARVLAQRRKWHRYTSQDDGRARVRVPEDELERQDARRGGMSAEHEPLHDVRQDAGEIEALKAHVQTMRELLERQDAAHAAELERIRDDQARMVEERTQLQDALQDARAEADHAKSDQVRMARDVANMFDELRALADRQAELHADRARLQAELESTRARIIDLQAESAQVRKEVADERVHSGTLVNQFERVHREHRTDTERERWPWWRRLIGR
jgi:chromosome segregation ATPase